MARYYFGNVNPVGLRFGWGEPGRTKFDTEIIGLVRNANYGKLREQPPRLIYFPAVGGEVIQVRTAGDPAALCATIGDEIQEVDSDLQISSVDTISEIVERTLVQEKLIAKLSGFFGILALLLTGIGLYGLMAYTVACRTQEIGIRMALGATSRHVILTILGQTLVLAAAGVALGLPVTVFLAGTISSMLFGVAPTDPATVSMSVGVMVAVAAVAGYLPARRASLLDPIGALRYE
jgi:predicted lysophospholipase L1 biosynthesis ABC-type transport system permease subunit